MLRNLIYFYRRTLYGLAYLKWRMFREKPEYEVNDYVIVKLRTAIYGAVTVPCRITGVNYRMFALMYDVILLEDTEGLPYGTRTFVQASNVISRRIHRGML